MKKLVSIVLLVVLVVTAMGGTEVLAAKKGKKPSVTLELKVRSGAYSLQPTEKKKSFQQGREYMMLYITPSVKEDIRIAFWNSEATMKNVKWEPSLAMEGVFKTDAAFRKEAKQIASRYSSKDYPYLVEVIDKSKVEPGKTLVIQFDGVDIGSPECDFVHTSNSYTPLDWAFENLKVSSFTNGISLKDSTWRVQVDVGTASSGKKTMKMTEDTIHEKPYLIKDKAWYEEMLMGINAERIKSGCEPLILLWEMQDEYVDHTMAMAKEKKIWHYDGPSREGPYAKKYKQDYYLKHGSFFTSSVSIIQGFTNTDAFYHGRRTILHAGMEDDKRIKYVFISTAENDLYKYTSAAFWDGIGRCPEGCTIKHSQLFKEEAKKNYLEDNYGWEDRWEEYLKEHPNLR